MKVFQIYSTWRVRLIGVIAVAFALFQLYTVGFGVTTPLVQRGTTLLFAATLAFLMQPLLRWPADETRPVVVRVLAALIDAAFVSVAVATCLYVILNEAALADRSGAETELDLMVAVAGVVMLLEMVRRVVGVPLAAILTVIVLYTYYGDVILLFGVPLGLAGVVWNVAGWRVGLGLAVLAVAAMAVAIASGVIDPEALRYQGVSLYRMAPYLWLTSEGTFGSIAGIMSQFIFIFVLFSAFLESLGSGKILIDLAFAGTGRFRGGPAQAAVAASSLFGMVSGSTMANVVSTGTLTIPLMIRAGFRRTFAAAVESVASSGGQIVPPIMGASVFIMAEIIGVPYVELMLYALIPAVLYFLSLSSSIFFEAGRLGIGRLSQGDIPDGRRAFWTGGFVLIPLFILLASIVGGETPGRAGFKAVLALLVMSDLARSLIIMRARAGWVGVVIMGTVVLALVGLAFGPIEAPAWMNAPVNIPGFGDIALNRLALVAGAGIAIAVPSFRVLPVLVPLWLATASWELNLSYPLLDVAPGVVLAIYGVLLVLGGALVVSPSLWATPGTSQQFGVFMRAVWTGLQNGSKNAVSLVAATYGIGLAVGLLVLTGLGVRLSILVSEVGQHSQLLSYVLVMCASLILGMGLPTVAAYLLLVMVVAPSMQELGTPIVAAHMFVFYFGVLSSITPPVALAAFGAAGIARSDPLATALTACRLALSAFIVPFLFVYHPELLLLEGSTLDVVYRLSTVALAVLLISSVMIGYGLGPMGPAVRVAAAIAALLLVLTPLVANAAGAALGLAVVLLHRRRSVATAP